MKEEYEKCNGKGRRSVAVTQFRKSTKFRVTEGKKRCNGTKNPEYINITPIDLLGFIREVKFQLTNHWN